MTDLLLAEFSDDEALCRGGARAARRALSCSSMPSRHFRSRTSSSFSNIAEPHSGRHVHRRRRDGGAGLRHSNIISAVIDYPYNSGGRPLDAWPAFMLVPFATGILVAAIAGFAAFLIETGLPRLHDPLFAVEGFERASQDRFVLALERPDARRATAPRHRSCCATPAPSAIREVEP